MMTPVIYDEIGVNLCATFPLGIDIAATYPTATSASVAAINATYTVGYQVPNAGRIDIPKGSIISPENSDCIKFVAGDLLNLAIKPLDLSVEPA